LLGVSAGLCRGIDAAIPPFARSAHERTESLVRAKLGDARFTSAWSEGYHVPAERLVNDVIV
jgi:hypothetical protein